MGLGMGQSGSFAGWPRVWLATSKQKQGYQMAHAAEIYARVAQLGTPPLPPLLGPFVELHPLSTAN